MEQDFVHPVEELKDDNIIKINKFYEEEFVNDINEYRFPFCYKSENHSLHKIQFGVFQKNLNDQGLASVQIEPACQVCLEGLHEDQSVIDLKDLLIKTYKVANQQCDKNSFKDCIDDTLILLEESFKRLQEVRERVDIYCQEVSDKIESLRQKASFYPPICVRDILTRIKDSKNMNQDEQNSTITSELKKLSSQIHIDERLNMQPIIKGASLDVSMYYLLLNKVKCDTNMINQCLDRGCFILNDIDQSENIPHYAEKLIKNIRTQAHYPNSKSNPMFDKQFLDYKNKLEYIGLQENEMNVDKTIDFLILYMYELYKFQGVCSGKENIHQQTEINYKPIHQEVQSFNSQNEGVGQRDLKGLQNKPNFNLAGGFKNQQPSQIQINQQGRILILRNNPLMQPQPSLANQSSNDQAASQIKQPRRMRIFEIQNEKENKAVASMSSFILKNNNDVSSFSSIHHPNSEQKQ